MTYDNAKKINRKRSNTTKNMMKNVKMMKKKMNLLNDTMTRTTGEKIMGRSSENT